METIAPYLFQLFSVMAIVLPVLGGIFALILLWRAVRALEGIHKTLEKLGNEKEK
ncbi:MAG: hypothetical protein WB502_12680 [Thermoactinomyces sp.]